MATSQVKWPEGDGGWQGLDGSEEALGTGMRASKQDTQSVTEGLGSRFHAHILCRNLVHPCLISD